MNNSSERVINLGTFIARLLQNTVKWPNFVQFEERRTGLLKRGVGECLKGQSHQDLVLLENPLEALVLIVSWRC